MEQEVETPGIHNETAETLSMSATSRESIGTQDTSPIKRLPKSERKRVKREMLQEGNKLKRREKEKRKRRRVQTQRRLTLESMPREARLVFLEKDRLEKEEAERAQIAHLETSFLEGRPKIAINCAFDDVMNDVELTSLARQIQLTYGIFKTSSVPFQLHITSMTPQNAAHPRLEKFGFSTWRVHFHDKPYWEVFSSAIVLSPDAEEEIDEVDPDATYIIGGLVDRTVSKFETLTQAREHAVARCLRLPLRRFAKPGCASILNIDCVVQLLLRRHAGLSWTEAFEQCLPKRQLTPGFRKSAKTLEPIEACV